MGPGGNRVVNYCNGSAGIDLVWPSGHMMHESHDFINCPPRRSIPLPLNLFQTISIDTFLSRFGTLVEAVG